MEFRNRKVEVGPGEITLVHKGVEHRPITEEVVWMLLFEPQDIHHTGGVDFDHTVNRAGQL